MYFKNNQNVGILSLFVVSHVVVKMAESFAANDESRFRSLGKENQSCCMGAFLSVTDTKKEVRRSFTFNVSSFTNCDHDVKICFVLIPKS